MQKDKMDTTKQSQKTSGKKSATKADKSTTNQQPADKGRSQYVSQSMTATKNKSNWAKTIVTVVILALVALAGFFAVRYFVGQSNPPVATLQGETAMRMGQTQVLIFDSKEIKNGQNVCWYINGKRVYCQKYDGKPLEYRYNATHEGIDHIRVDVAGKTYKWMNVSVGKRLATVTVNNYVITYGEKLPSMGYQANGINQENLANCRAYVDDEPTQVGIYPIKFECNECTDCDFAVTQGALEIVPRKLQLVGDFAKVYDGTNTISLEDVQLEGVLPGDDVYLCPGTIAYFDDKNAGEDKQIFVPSIALCGKDAANYCVETTNLYGQILPKPIKIEGTKIENKHYDGTTKATFECVGNLVGVVEGDVVAIGNCQASFGDSKVGKNKKVCVSNVCLVGRDKANYTLEQNFDCTANIEKGYMDLLLNKPDAIHGQTKNK